MNQRSHPAWSAAGIAVLSLILCATVSAQHAHDDVVQLRNGRTIVGKVFESHPGTTIGMFLADGQTLIIPIDSIRAIDERSSTAPAAGEELRNYIVLRDSSFILGEIVEQSIGTSTNTYRRGEFDATQVRSRNGSDTVSVRLNNGWVVFGTNLRWSRTGDLTLDVLPSILVRRAPDGTLVGYLESDLARVETQRPSIETRVFDDRPTIADVPLSREDYLHQKRKGIGAELFGGYPLYFGISAGFDAGSGWGMHLSLATNNPAVILYALSPDTNTAEFLVMQDGMFINIQSQLTMPIAEDWGAYIGGGISIEDFVEDVPRHNGDTRFLPTFSGGLHWYFSDQVYITGGMITQPLSAVLGFGFSNISSFFLAGLNRD